jgi:hypothetical protein
MGNKNRIRKELLHCILFIAIAILIPFVSLYWDCRPQNESIGTWFQRSGSFMVLLAVLVEYKLFSINGDVNPNGVISVEQGELSEKFGRWHKVSTYLAVLLAILGTLIWGYGDLLYTLITSHPS